jgi:uncharacterized protein involved in outer membrane biogenesis
MKRLAKWLLTIVATLLLLLAIGLVVLVNFDWNRVKPSVAHNISESLGRSIVINGDLRVRWYRDSGLDGWRAWVPSPHVFASDVTVGNSAWARTPRFGHADTIEFDFGLLPLLTHHVSIQLMRFVNPDAAFERLDDDRENWTFTDKPSTWTCDIGRIAVDRATFTFFDHLRHVDVAGNIEALGDAIEFDKQVSEQIRQARLEVLQKIGPKAVQRFEERADKRAMLWRQRGGAPQRYAFAWTAHGTFQKEPFKGSGKLGGVYYLRNPDRPFPLLGDVRIGDTHIVLVGTLTDPADLDAVDLRLWLAGQNLSHLYDIAALPLPNTPPYAMEGRLAGRFHSGAIELRYQDFTARIGQSDLSGNLEFQERQPRSSLNGKIVSEELQFRDLAPLIGAEPGPIKPGEKLLPETPFRPQRWRAMDADVEFTGDHVFRDSQLPIHQVDTHIVMNDAVLSLDPLKFRYADGDVMAHMRFDGRAAPIKGTFDLSARGMQLKNMFPAAEGKQLSLGRADGEAKLTGSGQSVGALLSAANGELRVLLDNGTVSKSLLESAGLNLPNMIATKLFGDRQVRIDCAAADLVAKDGVFDARTFIIDTDISQIKVSGTISLRDESVDLVVHPNSKSVRLLSLHSPLHVRGPFANIDVSVDKGALLTRAATALGLAVVAAPAAALVPLTSTSLGGDKENRCNQLLAQSAEPAAKGKH